jgi:hypothetical protein
MPIHELVLTDTWFIGHNDTDTIIHNCFCPANTRLDSGQEIIELFDNEEAYLKRLAELELQKGISN